MSVSGRNEPRLTKCFCNGGGKKTVIFEMLLNSISLSKLQEQEMPPMAETPFPLCLTWKDRNSELNEQTPLINDTDQIIINEQW